jgi:hypothetical protein
MCPSDPSYTLQQLTRLSCRTGMANAVSLKSFAPFLSRQQVHLEQRLRAKMAVFPTVGLTLLLDQLQLRP